MATSNIHQFQPDPSDLDRCLCAQCSAAEESHNEALPSVPFVRLIASDGHEFYIKKEYILISPTIVDMLAGPFPETEEDINVVTFNQIPSRILERICTYLVYRAYYDGSAEPIPVFPVADNIALELLMAANFLGI